MAGGGAPELTVVVPCLDAGPLLDEQLDALASQVCDRPWELVLADNGSTDDSRERFLRRASSFASARVVDATRARGTAPAINDGTRSALGAKVVLIDADDVAAPGWLAAMSVALDAHPIVAARFDCVTLNDPATVLARGEPQRDGLMSSYGYLPYAGSGGLGYRRAAFDAVGGFAEELRYLFDVDFCWRAQELGYQLAFVPDAVVRVRFRSSGGDTFRQARGWARIEPMLYRRHASAGMPRSAVRGAARGWARAAVRVGELRDPERRYSYLRALGQRVGRLEGSVRARRVFL